MKLGAIEAVENLELKPKVERLAQEQNIPFEWESLLQEIRTKS